MNRYLRALVVVPTGALKMGFAKLFHPKSFHGPALCMVSPHSEITLNGGRLSIGSGFKMRDGAKLRVRKGAECVLGKNVSLNSNDMIVCHEKIILGDNIQLSPNVQIYDHDHDYRAEGGLAAMKYKTAPVEIGNNVWIGADVTVLPGVTIGDNTVIGAGSVVTRDIPSGVVAVGNPCRVLREITEEDNYKYKLAP